MFLENEGNKARYDIPEASFYTDILLSYTWKLFTFDQRLESMFTPAKNSVSFAPIDINYESTLRIKVNKSIEFGAKHYCLHPVIDTKSMINTYRRAAGNKVYVKILLK